MSTKLRAETEAGVTTKGSERPLWQAKTVWIAVALMLLGGGIWIKERTSARSPSTPAPASEAQFSNSTPTGMPTARTQSGESAAPATFRFGASYLGGFLLGWTLRRFLKWTLLFSGTALVLVFLGRKFGWFEVDWATVEGHLRHSLAWLRGEADAFRQFITGYLPSAGGAAVGVFLGFRRR